MKKRVRILSLLLALSMVLVLFAGCGGGGEESAASQSAPQAESKADAPDDAAEPAPEAAPHAPQEAEASAPAVGSALEEAAPQKEPSPYTGSTIEGLSYPVGDPDNPTEFSLFSVWGMGFDEYLDSWNSLPRLKEISEATGCTLRFHEVSQTGATEQFNLMIASGDMTDIIQAADYYVGGLGQAYADEVIIDLSDIIEENAPIYYDLLMNHTNDTTKDTVLTDGLHLSMNTLKDEVVSDMGLVVRGDWLDELGMEAPETLDQFTDMLYAIKDKYDTSETIRVDSTCEIQYMDGVFGVSMFKLSGATDISPFVMDGEVTSALLSDDYRAFIEYVRQLYTDGIIHPDFFTISGDDTATWGVVSSGECGVWRIGADALHRVPEYTEVEGSYATPIPKLVKEEGDKYLFGNQAAFADNKGYSLTNSCEEPELALQFFDWFFTDEGALISNYGIEGETYEFVDGKPVYTDIIMNNPEGMSMMFAVILNTFNQTPMMNIVSKMWVGYTVEEEAAIHLWSDTTNDDSSRALPTAAALSTEETSQISNEVTAVISYASEELLKFVTSATELNDESWEAFKDGCITQGLDTCLEVYNTAYEQYLNGERVAAASAPGGPPPDGGGAPPEGPPPA